jgi:hypothetical protein
VGELDTILGKVQDTQVDKRLELRSKSPLRKRSLSRSNLLMEARAVPSTSRVKVSRRSIISQQGAQIVLKAKCKQIKRKLVAKTF